MNRLTALQRGLGRGFLRAQKAGRAAQRDILTCVLSDPRWDRQVDDRAEYYSQLMISTQASWRAVESYLKEFAISPELDYLDRVLVLEVLAQAAWRGQEEPGRLLARYLGEPLLLEDIRGAVYKIGGEELVSRVLGPAQLGWIDVTPPEHAPEPPVSAGTPISTLLPRLEGQAPRAAEAVGERASVEELLRYRESAGLHGYHKVMKLLGQRGYSELLQEAAQALQRSDLKPMQRRAYIDYLVALPASATLRLARSWLNHPQLARAGELIMARRAEPEDFALLIESGRRALDAENQMAVCCLVEGLTRIDRIEAVEFLAECYENMLYSYGRSFVIQALAKYRKHRLAALLLEEALWDCQFDVRLRAVAQIWKPDRLGEIIADPYENGEIKEAATRSLVGGAPWSSN